MTENIYGVKVGDRFRCHWGYDMSLNDFYEVVKVTQYYVYLIHVEPEKTWISGDPTQGSFKVKKEGMWIKQDEDPKRFKSQKYGDQVLVYLTNYKTAFLMDENDYECTYWEDHWD